MKNAVPPPPPPPPPLLLLLLLLLCSAAAVLSMVRVSLRLLPLLNTPEYTVSCMNTKLGRHSSVYRQVSYDGLPLIEIPVIPVD